MRTLEEVTAAESEDEDGQEMEMWDGEYIRNCAGNFSNHSTEK